jgi:hypothetical protein
VRRCVRTEARLWCCHSVGAPLLSTARARRGG